MKKIPLYQKLLMNTIPLLGYWFWDWSMFSIVYLYWVEAIIVSFFLALRVWLARGPEPKTGKVLPGYSRFFSGLKLLIVRCCIMFFYWIFIFLFVAMGAGQPGTNVDHGNLDVLIFLNRGFNFAVLAFTLSQIIEFYRNFINEGERETRASSSFWLILDAKIIIIHVVIVLGTFASQYLNRYSEFDRRLPGLGFVLVLFFIKSLADWAIHSKFLLRGTPEKKE